MKEIDLLQPHSATVNNSQSVHRALQNFICYIEK